MSSISNEKKRLVRAAKIVNTSAAWGKYRECAVQYQIGFLETKIVFFLIHSRQCFWRTLTASGIQFNPRHKPYYNLPMRREVPFRENLELLTFSTVFTVHSVINLTGPHTLSIFSLWMPLLPILMVMLPWLILLRCSSPCDVAPKCVRNTSLTSSLFLSSILQESLDTGLLVVDREVHPNLQERR